MVDHAAVTVILVFSEGRAVIGTCVRRSLVELDRRQNKFMDLGFWLLHYKAIPI